MDYIALMGTIGVAAIAFSWIPQTLEVIKNKKTDMELKFIIIYSIGSLLLLIYSVLIHDLIFTVLNFITTVLAGLNLFFALK